MIAYPSYKDAKKDYTVVINNTTTLPVCAPTIESIDNAYTFNKSIIIGDGISDCTNFFRNCVNFNQSINIPDSVVTCYGMFYGCVNFNKSVEIPNSVIDCTSMFGMCNNFNKPVPIGSPKCPVPSLIAPFTFLRNSSISLRQSSKFT